MTSNGLDWHHTHIGKILGFLMSFFKTFRLSEPKKSSRFVPNGSHLTKFEANSDGHSCLRKTMRNFHEGLLIWLHNLFSSAVKDTFLESFLWNGRMKNGQIESFLQIAILQDYPTDRCHRSDAHRVLLWHPIWVQVTHNLETPTISQMRGSISSICRVFDYQLCMMHDYDL